MSTPFVGELRLFSFSFPPKGWALCNGQLLSIQQNAALFSLIGTFYGGDGRVNFALPDLRSRCPMHMGSAHPIGERAGEESHTLTIQELPSHTHTVKCSTNTGTQANPGGNFWAPDDAAAVLYRNSANATMAGTASGNAGNSQAHDNMAPYLVLSYCIALQGIFPSQN